MWSVEYLGCFGRPILFGTRCCVKIHHKAVILDEKSWQDFSLCGIFALKKFGVQLYCVNIFEHLGILGKKMFYIHYTRPQGWPVIWSSACFCLQCEKNTRKFNKQSLQRGNLNVNVTVYSVFFFEDAYASMKETINVSWNQNQEN